MISICRNSSYNSPRNNLIKPFHFYLLVCVKSTPWLSKKKKNAATAISRQQEIEIMRLSITYYRDTFSDLTPTWLLCRDQWERTSVDNRLKTQPFLMRRWVGTNGLLKERCTTEYMSTFSAWVPVILLFLTRPSEEFEEKSSGSKTFGFLSTNCHLT